MFGLKEVGETSVRRSAAAWNCQFDTITRTENTFGDVDQMLPAAGDTRAENLVDGIDVPWEFGMQETSQFLASLGRGEEPIELSSRQPQLAGIFVENSLGEYAKLVSNLLGCARPGLSPAAHQSYDFEDLKQGLRCSRRELIRFAAKARTGCGNGPPFTDHRLP